MKSLYSFGYPTTKRVLAIGDAVTNARETYLEEYQGKYRYLPVIEIPIKLPVAKRETTLSLYALSLGACGQLNA